MSRIYGECRSLDYSKVEKFFRDRSGKIAETGPLSVTMYQTEEVAKLRDRHEKAAVAPLLRAGPGARVLDIGCGTGRWGTFLSEVVGSYLGVDFCDAYIQVGQALFAERKLDPNRFRFQQLRATDVSADTLSFSPPFDLLIIAGLVAFLNDADARSLFDTVSSLSSVGATIYLREPVAIDQRLTLLDFPSEQLQQSYSAVYRTDAEMRSLFSPLVAAGAVLEAEFILFPPDMLSLATRQETNQRVYILRMPG